MNSALKPVLASAGVPQPGGQSSPAKGNVASVNHASVGHPQGAQNSLNHASNSNNLAVQNLTQHGPAPPPAPHAVPSMAPVSANMAQMAHNMSNHGNLSHASQGGPAGAAPAPAAAPSVAKAPVTSSPLSLVAEKPNASQPLALTRTLDKPEKKEPDSTGQANGTIDSPKPASNAPVTLKAQNPETNKDKIDIAKTSPSTTKPPEKPSLTPTTPQKPETASPATIASQPEVVTQPKVTSASEPSEKPASKPAEPKPAPIADVAPTQSEPKPVPESATIEPSLPEKDKAPASAKQDTPAEIAKPEPAKPEEKKEAEKPSTEEKTKEIVVKEKPEPSKKEDTVDAPVKVVEKEKIELKKVEPKKETKPRSTLKLATVTPPLRKRRHVSPVKSSDGPSPAKKAVEGDSTPDARTKRNRTKVQLYQSPTPELAMATKLSASAGRSTPTKPNDDKLIVFYKNEYLAVRNAEGGFYVCQAMQNVYRSTRKIKIRWLSQDKKVDPSGETYKPDFYDVTDMECVLTTLSLSRAAGGAQLLRSEESARAASILQRALRAETSPGVMQLTPEHPDGLDLSLYTDESQLEKRARKRAASKSSPRNKDSAPEPAKNVATPAKKARPTPKRSPKSTRQAKATPAPPPPLPAKTNNNKRKSTGSTTIVPAAKTATAVVEKAKAGRSAPKRTPPKPRADAVATPQRKGRRSAAKEVKPSPALPQPSTSTGKTGRARKAPARK